MHPYTQDLTVLDEPQIPLADNVCDTPAEALGASGRMNKYGECLDCGFPGSCHDY